MAALFAARGKHFATVLRGHPFEEAMDALAAAIVRLERPLHEITPGGKKKSTSL
jgi:hypothetical protein